MLLLRLDDTIAVVDGSNVNINNLRIFVMFQIVSSHAFHLQLFSKGIAELFFQVLVIY